MADKLTKKTYRNQRINETSPSTAPPPASAVVKEKEIKRLVSYMP